MSAAVLTARHDLGGNVHAAFTTRAGGRSAPPYDALNLGAHVGDDPTAVIANRRLLEAAVGVPVAFMEQVHGAGVAVLDGTPTGPVPDVDALVTARPELALVVLVADCLPVLLADPEAGVVAAAHAGRGGVAQGVVPAVVAAMRELGARPERMTAVVGPGVCGRCYEVPPALRDEVDAAVPGTAAVTRAGTPAVDLAHGVGSQLRDAGLRGWERDARCTYEDAALFSHRRDGPRTGRFAGVVWRRAA